MRRRTRLALGAILIALVLILWFCLRESEPTYKGRSLSYWVRNYWPLPETRLKGPQPDEAIRDIGTNALPFLLRWMQAEEPRYRVLLFRPIRKLPDFLKPNWARSDFTPLQLQSAHAFKALGTSAIPALPQLAKIAADSSRPKPADMALTALHQMGTNGTPSLLAAAQDPSHPYRSHAIYLLGISLDLNGHEEAVVSYFLFALKDPAVNDDAASALGSLGLRPEIVVPELASFLQDTNSQRRFRSAVVVSLLYFGEKAASALPQLTNAASDPDAEVRSQATNAITQIQLAIRRAETK